MNSRPSNDKTDQENPSFWGKAWNSITTNFGNIFPTSTEEKPSENQADLVSSNGGNEPENEKSFVEIAGDFISSIYTKGKKAIKTILPKAITSPISSIKDTLKTIKEEIINSIDNNLVSEAVNKVSQVVDQAKSGLEKGINTGIKQIEEKTHSSLNDVLEKVKTAVFNFIADLQQEVGNFFTAVGKSITNILMAPINWFVGLFRSFSDFLKNNKPTTKNKEEKRENNNSNNIKIPTRTASKFVENNTKISNNLNTLFNKKYYIRAMTTRHQHGNTHTHCHQLKK